MTLKPSKNTSHCFHTDTHNTHTHVLDKIQIYLIDKNSIYYYSQENVETSFYYSPHLYFHPEEGTLSTIL